MAGLSYGATSWKVSLAIFELIKITTDSWLHFDWKPDKKYQAANGKLMHNKG